MQLTNAQRAEVLCNALPYIQAYKDKIVVVKYGGNAMVNEDIKRSVMGDVMLLRLIGVRVVVVHGGGPEISGLLKRLGKQSAFVDGLRVTDAETAEVVQMVLAGKVNKSLVSLLQTLGGRAVGLCGLDGGMIEARQLDERLGFVGEITRVDPQIVLDVLEKGYIPVVSTVARGENGETYNINADTAAARLAAALRAQCLISMTDTARVLRDPHDPQSVIPYIGVSEAPQLMREGVISGGMIPKIGCCIEAIRRGVKKVFVLDGTTPHAILIEILTNEGIGTMFR